MGRPPADERCLSISSIALSDRIDEEVIHEAISVGEPTVLVVFERYLSLRRGASEASNLAC